jgi:hypothetical protein
MLVAQESTLPKQVDRTTALLARMTPMQRAHSKLFDRYKSGTRLLDKGVSISDTGHRGFQDPDAPQPTWESSVTDVACASDIVFGATVMHAVSNPIDDGTFIFTDYTVRIEDVIYRKRTSNNSGENVVVTRPGGEIAIGAGAPVSATTAEFPLLVVGQRYVFFVKRVVSTGAFQSFDPMGTIAVHEGAISPLVPFPVKPPNSGRDALAVGQFSQLVQRSACATRTASE